MNEYIWDLIWDVDVCRWPDEYAVYLLLKNVNCEDWVVKLNIKNQTFLVSKKRLLNTQAREITRLTFFEFLKQYEDSTYKVYFERNHQNFVGQLLNALTFSFEQKDKICSVGVLDKQRFEQKQKDMVGFLKNELKKDKKV